VFQVLRLHARDDFAALRRLFGGPIVSVRCRGSDGCAHWRCHDVGERRYRRLVEIAGEGLRQRWYRARIHGGLGGDTVPVQERIGAAQYVIAGRNIVAVARLAHGWARIY
jgi:hypothetical protein